MTNGSGKILGAPAWDETNNVNNVKHGQSSYFWDSKFDLCVSLDQSSTDLGSGQKNQGKAVCMQRGGSGHQHAPGSGITENTREKAKTILSFLGKDRCPLAQLPISICWFSNHCQLLEIGVSFLLKGCFTFKINFSFHLFFLNSSHIHDPSKSLSPYSSFIILEVICYLLMKQTNKQKTIEFSHFEVFWDHYVASVYRVIMFFPTCKWVFWSLHWLLSY